MIARRRVLRFVALCAVLVLVAACFLSAGGCRRSREMAREVSPELFAPEADEAAEGEKYARSAAGEAATSPTTAIDWGAIIKASLEAGPRKIVYTGDMHLETEDVRGTAAKAVEVARGLGGYVGSSQFDKTPEGVETAQVTLRVPWQRFHEAMDALSKLGDVVTRKDTSEDVTDQFTDLEARLATLRLQEERVLDLLRRTRNLQDVLQVENELTRVRGEIEQYKAQLEYLQQQVSFSTISLRITQTREYASLVAAQQEMDKWRPGQVFRRAWSAVRLFYQVVATIAIWLLMFVPVWVPIGLVIFYGGRWLFRTSVARLEG